MTIIDARDTMMSIYRPIPGALLIPLTVLRSGIPLTLLAAKDKPIVVCCGDGVKIRPQVTHLLHQAGHTRTVNLQRGIEGWGGAGFPVRKS